MDAKQFLIAFIGFTLMTLRESADHNGHYDNGAQYRLDLAFTGVQARLFDGVHDAESVDVYPEPKHVMRLFCQFMRESLALECIPGTKRIEHTTDAKIDELFGLLDERLSGGLFDNLLDLFESMAIDASDRDPDLPPLALQLVA